ncbi:ABC transporter permease subunit [Candidatus Bathyarchaeota archaeon]|nr:ABC transporter permease subunit [Candidatus Bathyarchaeota archaeon]
MWTIARKELIDHLTSVRFIIIFAVLTILVLCSAYEGVQQYFKEGSMMLMPGQSAFLAVFTWGITEKIAIVGSLLGIAIGFAAISQERDSGSLITLLTHPIFRDSVINGKLAAGACALTFAAFTSIALGLTTVITLTGVAPTGDEMARLLTFMGISSLYLIMWLGVSVLFSVMMRDTTSSLLASIITWLVSTDLIYSIASLIATLIAPFGGGVIMHKEGWKHFEVMRAITRFSPTCCYRDIAHSVLGSPFRSSVIVIEPGKPQPTPPSLLECLALSWPEITVIAVVLIAAFAASYVLFMRQEIR